MKTLRIDSHPGASISAGQKRWASDLDKCCHCPVTLKMLGQLQRSNANLLNCHTKKPVMKPAIIYSLKVWLTTSILTPILITLMHCYFLASNHLNPFHNPKVFHRELLHLITMIEGTCIFMVPLGLGLYYSVILLNKRSIRSVAIKGYLSIIGVTLAVLPDAVFLFYMIWSNPDSPFITITIIGFTHAMVCYALSVLAGIWFYKLKPNPGSALSIQS